MSHIIGNKCRALFYSKLFMKLYSLVTQCSTEHIPINSCSLNCIIEDNNTIEMCVFVNSSFSPFLQRLQKWPTPQTKSLVRQCYRVQLVAKAFLTGHTCIHQYTNSNYEQKCQRILSTLYCSIVKSSTITQSVHKRSRR